MSSASVGHYTKAQLVKDLLALAKTAVACKADLESWNCVARAVQEKLMANSTTIGRVPESILDYLADAEIRATDPEYAAVQHRILMRFVDQVGLSGVAVDAAVG